MAARTNGLNGGHHPAPLSLGLLGAGYVGLVTAVCLAHLGHHVTVVETDRDRLRRLVAGRAPFHEPDLQQLLTNALGSGRMDVTGDAAALAGSDAVLVCVGTPLRADGAADLSQVRAACRAIALHAGDAVVVMRSTLPIGSDASLDAWLGRPGLRLVATNPEFLRQGTAIHDFLQPTRIVIGTPMGTGTRASSLVRRMYAGIDAPLVLTDFASADMIKNAANAFLATKLSFINEVADLCEAYGADIDAVVEGIGLDPRIGHGYLRPGIGFGGSCLPKELANLRRMGQLRGLPLPLIAAASRENDTRASRLADRLEMTIGDLASHRVAILGLAFKPHTDDLRYSPALGLAGTLLERGARVVAHDPAVRMAATADIPELERAKTARDAIEGADLVILATEWPEYAACDWRDLALRANVPLLYDGRNALEVDQLTEAGWTVLQVGHATSQAARPEHGAGTALHAVLASRAPP